MKDEIKTIIDKLEKAQHMIFKGRPQEAGTIIYEAQSDLRLIADRKA